MRTSSIFNAFTGSISVFTLFVVFQEKDMHARILFLGSAVGDSNSAAVLLQVFGVFGVQQCSLK